MLSDKKLEQALNLNLIASLETHIYGKTSPVYNTLLQDYHNNDNEDLTLMIESYLCDLKQMIVSDYAKSKANCYELQSIVDEKIAKYKTKLPERYINYIKEDIDTLIDIFYYEKYLIDILNYINAFEAILQSKLTVEQTTDLDIKDIKRNNVVIYPFMRS